MGDASAAILKWVRLYCGDQPQAGAAVQTGWQQAPQAMCIDRVADIEESIWAPRFGLKGMIDATVTTRFGPLQQVCCCCMVSSLLCGACTC